MPLYEFESETGEYCLIFFEMNSAPKLGEFVEYEGNKWKRIPSIPRASVDSKIDPNSKEDFVRYTGSRKGTLGDLQDLSKEMSEARAAKNGGIDPVKEKYFDNQQNSTGIEPLERRQKRIRENLSKMGVTIKEKKREKRK